ncbi:MAG: PD40 domain-containing protein [Thermoleophilia bacterium]|nr:PD40 domain-containing protein [Thermoleophilia bacterium]
MIKRTARAWTAVPVMALMILSLSLAGCKGLSGLDRLRDGAQTDRRVITVVPPETQADANSGAPAVSADSRFVAFESDATNLVNAVTTGATGIFVKDTQSGKVIQASSSSDGVPGNRDSGNPAISSDGRFVAFDSTATNLVPDDNNDSCVLASGVTINCGDVFIKDVTSGETALVSTDAAGVQGDYHNSDPAISADGRYVAFRSAASNLVPGITNGRMDIFVKDTRTGRIERISTAADGAEADGDSIHPSISADGRHVAFSSTAANLVPGDSNGKPDVFVKDRQTGSITRVSTGTDGEQADDASRAMGLVLSADGRFVAFESAATNLVAGITNGKRDVFIKDVRTGELARASVGADGDQGLEDSYGSISLSRDGRWVAFRSDAPNLVEGDTNLKADIFVKDLHSGAIARVSTGQDGAQGNGSSENAAISADGRWAAFDSSSSDLIVGDTNDKRDIFLKDIVSGGVTRVSTSTTDVT